jgi:transforming growth factor-beta-induced protein
MKNLSIFKFLSFAAVAALLSLTLVSCKDDDDAEPAPTQNIAQIVQGNSNFSTLLAALQATDLDAALAGTGPFTVFAPTNAAFNALPAGVLQNLLNNPDELAKVLQYHVVSGNVPSASVSTGAVPTLLGESLNVVKTGSAITINGTTNVIQADLQATNGVIHIIDQVLVPGEVNVSTIAQLAAGNANLSTLVAILSLPEMADLLAAANNASANLTVFAPTNDAFAALLTALGKTSLSELPVGIVKEIVQYHILGSKVLSTQLTAGPAETLLEGEDVVVSLGGGVKINDANVVAADVEAINGVVHVVDKVLLPSFVVKALGTIVEVPLFSNDFTTLVAAVRKAGLFEALVDPNASLTVFAPTNEAFEAAGITSLDGLSAADLTPVLLYHVVGAKVMSTDLSGIAGGIVSTLLDATAFGKFYLSLGSEVYINGSSKVTAVDIEKSNGVIHVIDKTLLPPTETLVDIAVRLSTGTPAQFTTLVALLTDASRADILAALDDEANNFTVFAPTDAAFEAIASVVATLTPAQITEVLQYHVLQGRVFSTDLADGITPAMLNGEDITINVGDGVSVTDATNGTSNVIGANVHATNGVIHVIDRVLIPTL